MKKIAIFFIVFYQKFLSPDTGLFIKPFFRGKVCGQFPTCSEYAKQAIEKHGFFKGSYLGIKRIIRCKPSVSGKIEYP